MNLTMTRPSDSPTVTATTTTTSLRPSAVALRASVAAVRDALAHLDDDAVLAVPTGTPHENFEIVEWCARNGKPVINRFDPWPLDHLMVQNRRGDTPLPGRPTQMRATGADDATVAGPVDITAPARRRSRSRRHPLRALRRVGARGDRPPGHPSQSTPIAQALAHRGIGPF